MEEKPTYKELEDEIENLRKKLKTCKNGEYFKSLTENSCDAITVIDKTGKSTYRSPSYQKIMGFTPKEIESKDVFENVYEEDKEKLRNLLFDSIKTFGITKNISFRAYHKDGTLRYLEGTGKNMLNSPTVKGIVVNYRDVTDRIKTEKILTESEKNYKNIINNLTDAYYRADSNGKVTLASPSCIKMFGYSKMEDVIGGYVDTLYPDPIQRNEFLYLLKKNGEVKNYRTKLKRKDNSTIFVETSASIITDENGKYTGVEGIVRDITDRKKTEQALLESQQKLQDIIKTKDKFFSIIAHDLKSPFNAIIGFSELLSDNFDNFRPEQQKEFINLIKESSKNTFNLLENLLLWASSQQGVIDFKPEKENLYLLAHATTELLKQALNNKNIKLINNISEDININADKNMVMTIFRNIINNAIKFTGKNGEITLSSKLISNQKTQNFVEITVKDNGVGIEQKNIDRLFTLSKSISTRGTENESGTGLGLIICKEFIKKHCGEIRVKSKKGKGSSFIFTLPYAI